MQESSQNMHGTAVTGFQAPSANGDVNAVNIGGSGTMNVIDIDSNAGNMRGLNKATNYLYEIMIYLC